jgi:hypothetical protein
MTSPHNDQAREPWRLTALRSPETCLSEQEIEDYIFDRLSETTVEAVEQHFLGCAPCADRLESAEVYATAFRRAARILEEEDKAREAQVGRGLWKPTLAERILAWWDRPCGLTPRFALAGAMAVLAVAIIVPLSNPGARYASVSLHTQRGAENPLTITSENRLRLSMDLTEIRPLPAYHVELVDAAGALVREATLTPGNQALEWKVEHLAPGQYWVRLADGRSGSLLREYGLLVSPR